MSFFQKINPINELNEFCEKNQEFLEKLLKILENGYCIGCSVRICGNSQFLFYKTKSLPTSEEIYKELKQKLKTAMNVEENQTNPFKTKICPSCFGILQNDIVSDIIIKTKKRFYSSFKSFNISLQIPDLKPESKIIEEEKLDPSNQFIAFKHYLKNIIFLEKINFEQNFNSKMVPQVKAKLEICVKWIPSNEIEENNSNQNLNQNSNQNSIQNLNQNSNQNLNVKRKRTRRTKPKRKTQNDYLDEMEKIGLSLDVETKHQSIWITGNYEKYSRRVSHSPWHFENVKEGINSVQEFIAPHFMQVFKGKSIKFMSSGREDVDVRMLYPGRPFLIEIIDPHDPNQNIDFSQYEQMIKNQSDGIVCANSLRFGTIQDQTQIKEGEENKRKEYWGIVWLSKPTDKSKINQIVAQVYSEKSDSFVIYQKTPVRVLHRRAILSRERKIFSLQFDLINPHFLFMKTQTQAGTYIKEFVNSDFGRTSPSIAELFQCKAELVQLDVKNIIF
ncbi:tRNA pseudouridine synthase pus10-related [Anaeramoeba ignava]|uniref:tRNA pseudouridine(55) synthase n=1 Tax=Anaeramoeba ignava TaxID=1746090 RepID=A0A9Q0R6T2_ANAIG|nr:tRNA pseudouridine synthase pus10-related [Anaeramoeba ignava]